MKETKKIFVHALEGEPEDPDKNNTFTGKTERDIRVRWLLYDDSKKPPVPGPWKLKEQQPDRTNKIVLVRSEAWTERPIIDEVHLPFIAGGKNLADRLKEPRSDKLTHVDFAPVLTDPSTIEPLSKNKAVTVLPPQTAWNIFYLGFYWERPPFKDNPNLRKALTCAIDTQRASLDKRAAEPAVGPVPPRMPGYDKKRHHQPEFSRERAQEFYRSSNDPKPSQLTLVYTVGDTFASTLADFVAREIRNNLPIKVDPLKQAPSTWKDFLKAVVARQGDMFIYSWHQRSLHEDSKPGDPYDFLKNLFLTASIDPPNSTNLTKYSNRDVDDWLTNTAHLDQYKAQDKIIEDQPMVFLFHRKRIAAKKSEVENLTLGDGSLPTDRLTKVDVPPVDIP